MQIDIHYYAAYVMARLAGIRPGAARTIATASQYVDDAVAKDIQVHENGNKLVPIVTAHRLVELIENRDVNDQPFVWVPYIWTRSWTIFFACLVSRGAFGPM